MNAAPVGSREIANQGLVNLSSESLAIVEQLPSTVPALQTPTQASAAYAEQVEDSQTANAAPEQLGQLFYNEATQMGDTPLLHHVFRFLNQSLYPEERNRFDHDQDTAHCVLCM